jgi:hypothetical protein
MCIKNISTPQYFCISFSKLSLKEVLHLPLSVSAAAADDQQDPHLPATINKKQATLTQLRVTHGPREFPCGPRVNSANEEPKIPT